MANNGELEWAADLTFPTCGACGADWRKIFSLLNHNDVNVPNDLVFVDDDTINGNKDSLASTFLPHCQTYGLDYKVLAKVIYSKVPIPDNTTTSDHHFKRYYGWSGSRITKCTCGEKEVSCGCTKNAREEDNICSCLLFLLGLVIGWLLL